MTGGLRTLSCACFGVPFELAADSDLVLARMLERAPFGTESSGTPSGDALHSTLLLARGRFGYHLVVDDEVVAERVELMPLLDQFARELMVHVANQAPDRVFVHAGVVGWQGRALVLPGATFAGKTTLAAELVRAGATYYSDEYAVLDERGWVHPYPRDLQMRQAGGAEQKSVGVERLNGVAGTEAVPVAHVVFTEYVESGCWNPERVSAGAAVLEMLRHSIAVQRTPARVMATLAKMMETTTATRSERGEAREAVRFLLGAMEGGPLR